MGSMQISMKHTHTIWFKCTATNGVTTHCSIPKEGVEDGACDLDPTDHNSCFAGTLNNTPDINRTFKWQCAGQNGGITAECDLPNTTAFACSPEGYCLDGEYEDLPDTSTHNWFKCTENNGTVTHCSTSITNGTCGGDETGPYCLDGTYTLIKETNAYWKYNCVSSNNGTTDECFLCKNPSNYGPNEDETACLPSCGHGCSLSNAAGTCASGNACSDTANYNITPITSYQTPCCKRTPKTTSTTQAQSTTTTQAQPTSTTQAQSTTTTQTGVCPPNKKAPHYKTVGNQCLPSCGAACGASSAAGTCASGGNCSDTANYNITILTSYQTPCCKRTPKTTSTTQASVCPANKKAPHYKTVGNQCLPSCGAACGASSAAGTCASGENCSDTANYNITILTSYQTPCCKRTPKSQ